VLCCPGLGDGPSERVEDAGALHDEVTRASSISARLGPRVAPLASRSFNSSMMRTRVSGEGVCFSPPGELVLGVDGHEATS
jgi:hypothetical protein